MEQKKIRIWNAKNDSGYQLINLQYVAWLGSGKFNMLGTYKFEKLPKTLSSIQ